MYNISPINSSLKTPSSDWSKGRYTILGVSSLLSEIIMLRKIIMLRLMLQIIMLRLMLQIMMLRITLMKLILKIIMLRITTLKKCLE